MARFLPFRFAWSGSRWFLLCCLLWLTGSAARAQSPVWQQLIHDQYQLSYAGEASIRATATDSVGNVYVLGSFSGHLALGTTALVSDFTGKSDLFLAKWNTTSGTWVWALRDGSTSTETGDALAVRGRDIFVTGRCTRGSVIAGTALTVNFANNDYPDMYLAKYTDNGTSATARWAVNGGGLYTDYATGVAVSGSNVYVVGSYCSNATISGVTLTSAPIYSNIFVAKYTDAGNSVRNGWAQRAGGIEDGDYATAVVASGGGVYVTGTFVGQSSFGGIALTSTINVVGGVNLYSRDVFVAKYTDAGSSGAVAWAQRAGGTGTDIGRALVVRGSSVYVTGSFGTTATFGGVSLTAVPYGTDVFLAKYTDGGAAASVAWAIRDGAAGDDEATGLAMSGNDLYLSGNFEGASTTLAGTTLTGTPGATADTKDVFVARYTETGTTATGSWATAGGGTGDDAAYGLTVVPAGIFVGMGTGYATGYFGPAALPAAQKVGVLGVLTPGGSWQRIVTPVRAGSSRILASVADAAGNVYVTGTYYQQMMLGSLVLNGAGSSDVFVAKYSPTAGQWLWAVSGGGTGVEESTGIALSGSNVYVTGTFYSTYDFRMAGTPLSGAGFHDVFVAKFIDNGTTVSDGWALSGGGAGDEKVMGLAASGTSVYLMGTYTGQAAFGSTTLPTAQGYASMYLAKYTDNGTSATATWAIRDGVGPGTGNTVNTVQGLAVSGNRIYTAGTFSSGRNITVAGTALVGAGVGDVFLAKYLDNGSSVGNGWAVTIGGSDQEFADALTVSGNDVILAGRFRSSNFRAAGATLNNTSHTSMYLTKFTDNGTSATGRWAINAGHSPWYSSSETLQANAVAVNGANIYMAGHLVPGAVLVAGTALTSAGYLDPFVAKFTDGGTSASSAWAVRGGGAGTDNLDALTVTGTTVFVGGQMRLPSTFGTLTTHTSDAAQYYLARLVDGPVAAPVTSALAPATAAVGGTVTITGSGFVVGSTTVTLNGVPVPGVTVSPDGNSLSFVVPAGAVAGAVVVSTPNGTANAGALCVAYTAVAANVGRCGNGPVTLTASGAPTTGSYAWYAAATGGQPVATGNTLTLPGLTATTTVYVAISTGTGSTTCAGSRTAVVATVDAVPPAPVITFTAPATLTSSSASGNQWYLGGTALVGATGSSYALPAGAPAGPYTVVVTSAAGCASPASAPFMLTTTSSTASRAAAPLQLYPNPARGAFTLRVAPALLGAPAQLINALGQVVRQQELTAPQSEFSLRGLPPGAYVLRVRTADGLLTRPVLVE